MSSILTSGTYMEVRRIDLSKLFLQLVHMSFMCAPIASRQILVCCGILLRCSGVKYGESSILLLAAL